MDIEEEDVARLLRDPAFMEAVVAGLTKDKDVYEDLAEEVAGALEDALEDHPGFKQQILQAALDDATFMAKVTKALVDELTD